MHMIYAYFLSLFVRCTGNLKNWWIIQASYDVVYFSQTEFFFSSSLFCDLAVYFCSYYSFVFLPNIKWHSIFIVDVIGILLKIFFICLIIQTISDTLKVFVFLINIILFFSSKHNDSKWIWHTVRWQKRRKTKNVNRNLTSWSNIKDKYTFKQIG